MWAVFHKDEPIAFIQRSGEILYPADNRTPFSRRIAPIVFEVWEMEHAYQQAPPMNLPSVANYRNLLQYNRHVLAARYDQAGQFTFVTWEYNYDQTGVSLGHYFHRNAYSQAKEDFMLRSGLLDERKWMGADQLSILHAALLYRSIHDQELPYEDKKMIEKLLNQIEVQLPPAPNVDYPAVNQERERKSFPPTKVNTLKSKSEFYKTFFAALTQRGIEVCRSTSADYLADLFLKDQLIAFYTRMDSIEKNPFVTVPDRLMSSIQDLARKTALQLGICTEKPYTEKDEKIANGVYKLSEYGDVVLACKHHPLFEYVFSTYRLAPETGTPVQRQYFYDKNEALENFAVRSGLADARKLFSESELVLIYVEMVKFLIRPNDKTMEQFEQVQILIDKLEDLLPALKDQEIQLDYEEEFAHDYDGTRPT
ncbi:hypothetical protein [Paenibacillus ehimensis]|uniref:hypothetical protein n=1 Tax=Paenibacillus ehimensis TaxID=79264 RepID=UPI001C1DFA12|nr:hypothetical protein [Paenibacillus ehimensis]